MTTEPWDEIVSVAESEPVWSGGFPVPGASPVTWCWWQVWSTARFDLGFTARVGVEEDESVDRAVVEMVDGLTRGLVDELVMPSLASVPGWTVDRRRVEVVEMERRYGKGGEFRSVRGKVTVKVTDGRLLDPVMTSMNRFARSMGWKGKPLR